MQVLVCIDRKNLYKLQRPDRKKEGETVAYRYVVRPILETSTAMRIINKLIHAPIRFFFPPIFWLILPIERQLKAV
jgi:hypothetical protein